MSKKLGNLIKSARTDAGFTQEQLAKKVTGMTAATIGKAERGEMEPTKDQLIAIAKATGVTQKSFLEAMSKTVAAKKTTTSATAAKKKPTASTTSSSASKKATDDEYALTASEKKLIDLYRAADADTKKSAISVLKGENNGLGGLLASLMSGGKEETTAGSSSGNSSAKKKKDESALADLAEMAASGEVDISKLGGLLGKLMNNK